MVESRLPTVDVAALELLAASGPLEGVAFEPLPALELTGDERVALDALLVERPTAEDSAALGAISILRAS